MFLFEYFSQGEKEFKCEKCVRSFGLESLLDKHRLVHTESWPNKCTHCCKGFRTQRQVEIHERTHTGGQLEWKIKTLKNQKYLLGFNSRLCHFRKIKSF